ncbi:universal stress protein [Streptomyces iconiensis]|uniref:Universal stress protein n=1 Tax=Streptomyces iconiensis TaxID=1384038 RepID=A0ABT7A3Q4_9ACTN|nr:universal stress protein [Streptomyces iconiensis]MDJ1135491.1 universal stress protein [Streptomyces iconiensis]
MTRVVVVGTDGSAASLAAVEWAARTARAHELPLRVAHVAPRPTAERSSGDREDPLSGHAARERMLRAVCVRLSAEHPELPLSWDIMTGDDVAGCLAWSTAGSELLVLGARGEGGFDGLLLGSTAICVLREASCPVALVRSATAGEPSAGRRTRPAEVVLALDAREPDHEATAYAFGEAALRAVQLRAVHAWDLAPHHDPWQPYGPAEADRSRWETEEVVALSAALRPWGAKYPDVRLIPDVRRLSPAAALVRASAGAELLVAGIGPGPHGPVTDALAHHARCTVVFVPSARRHVNGAAPSGPSRRVRQ